MVLCGMHTFLNYKKGGEMALLSCPIEKGKCIKKRLVSFYFTCICWILDYAALLFILHYQHIVQELLESVQIRALQIICPDIDYHCTFTIMGLPSISEHHHAICELTFKNIYQDSSNKLLKLIPRRLRTFVVPLCKTNRFKIELYFCSLVLKM